MKNLTLLLSFLISVTAAFSQSVDQDTTKSEQLFVITKNDGTEYIGKILSDDGREVLIETEALGKIYIPKSEIRSIKQIEQVKEVVYGEFRNHGPFTTRYSFTTNALPIVKGENYAMVNLYGPEVHFAVTDHLNIGVMSTWIASPMILALKYSFKTKNEKVNLSIGTLAGTSGYLTGFRGFGGLHFGNITFGSRGNNVTLAGGYAYMRTGDYQFYPPPGTYYSNDSYLNLYSERALAPLIQGPIFSVAGIAQVGAKASFVFDSMIGVFKDSPVQVATTTITEPYYNTNPPYEYVLGYYRHDVAEVDRITTALFFMPGMRFQKNEKQAFQISLTGVTVFKGKGYASKGNYSFPIPMCSWYFKF